MRCMSHAIFNDAMIFFKVDDGRKSQVQYFTRGIHFRCIEPLPGHCTNLYVHPTDYWS